MKTEKKGNQPKKKTKTICWSPLIRCENCRFFDKDNDETCHRYPPSMIYPRSHGIYSDVGKMLPIECCFPSVNPGNWCGEFQPATGREIAMWRTSIPEVNKPT